MTEQDRLRRFLFEDAPVRGHWVRLDAAWREAREHQVLPSEVTALLGQSLAAATLLAGSLKFQGSLTLQLSGGGGRVSMLIAQATDALTLRGVAHVAADNMASGTTFMDLVGKGRLAVTVEQGAGAEPWQGIVPLDGDTLARSLESYFAVSEQLPTAMVLAADERHAAGLLLQKLPTPAVQGEAAQAQAYEVWDEATLLLATLKSEELLALEPEHLLRLLFGDRTLRLFDGEPVRFACRCDRARVAAMLRGMGQQEIQSIVAEQGAVTVTCEFCQRPYRFDAIDAQQLFLDIPVAGYGRS